MKYLGDFTTSNTVYVYFNTFDSNDPSASVTLTGLAVTDIEIYKNGSVTQRASDAGYTLLDTDGIDFDGITGIHGFSIDLSDNTDAGFFAAGAEYTVIVSSVTVDAATINFVAATFSIERAGGALALIKAGNLSANVAQWNGSAVATPTTAGVPEVDVTFVSGTAQTANDNGADINTLITNLSTVDTVVDGIQTDLDNATDGLGALKALIDTVDTNVDSVLVDTGTTIPALLPAALVGGRMDCDIGAISTSTTAADNLEASALGITPGACEGTPSTTVIQTDLAETTDDHYIGRIVVFTSGAAAGQATDITDYTGSTGTITVTALTTAPSASDTFVIV